MTTVETPIVHPVELQLFGLNILIFIILIFLTFAPLLLYKTGCLFYTALYLYYFFHPCIMMHTEIVIARIYIAMKHPSMSIREAYAKVTRHQMIMEVIYMRQLSIFNYTFIKCIEALDYISVYP